MAKQLNVNLAFTADTSQAKTQIQQLHNQLNTVMNQSSFGMGAEMTKNIHEASRAAAELKMHLDQATNVDTGVLDFGKLSQSLKKSGVTLETYALKLRNMGPEGQKAFSMLAQAVASADVPLRRSNRLLSEMWVTMKNTARWQISSSVLHGFMSALQSAYGYAQDLNESLNNIRIVTGQSVDQMSRFAETANKAAKALSTTTTEYTNASLIYYQQGLSDKDVKARTDITIKMANVAGESAEKVSDQLTAVWNNFYDGSKSLEHYADVMTALGAATASSTDEISEGLNKFAAVAETVGLSYEYAASALATVTATTRQSADVVGTAFKTLFARIQDLELGETLDDGTTLGKYSQGLAAVGVNIKDANGELKDMDQILNEMAAVWDTLNKDQQVSLAQTVAGIRQYTQLIALMDNWDFMEENLQTSNTATGTLQNQADIYEESWQAASNRVRASLEEVYSSMINDEAFIDLLNNVAKIIDGFDTLIDSAGGFKGVLSAIAAIIMSIKFDSVVSGMQNIAYNTRNWFDGGKTAQKEKIAQLKALQASNTNEFGAETVLGKTSNTVIQSQIEAQQYLIDNAKKLTTEEQRVYQILLDQKVARSEQAMLAAEAVSAAQLKRDDDLVALKFGGSKQLRNFFGNSNNYKKIEDQAKKIGEMQADSDGSLDSKEKIASAQQDLDDEVKKLKFSKEDTKKIKQFTNSTADLAKKTRILEKSTEDASEKINKQRIVEEQETEAKRRGANATDEATQAEQRRQKNLKISAKGFAQAGMSALSMIAAISMLSSTVEALEDPDLTGWEKFGRLSMSLVMVIPMLRMGLSELNKTFGITNAILTTSNILKAANLLLSETSTAALKSESLAQGLLNEKSRDAIATTFIETLAKKGLITEEQKDALQSKLLAKLQKAENQEQVQGIIQDFLEKDVKEALNKTNLKLIASSNMYLLILMAAIAIVIALVAGIKALINAYNADAIAAKNAAKSAETLRNALNETKQAYDDLKSSIEDYEDSKNAIDKLKEGTVEWKEVVQDTNSQVLELISKYPELAKYVSKVGEVLEFDPKGLEEFKNQQLKEVSKVAVSAYSANIEANTAATKSDITNLARASKWETYDANGGIVYNSATSGDVQAVLDALNDPNNSKIDFKDVNDLTAALKDQGITDENLIAALHENIGSILQLDTTIKSRNQANDLYKEEIASNYLSANSEKYETAADDEKDAMNKAVASQILTDDALRNWSQNGRTKKDLAKEYAEDMGWDYTKVKIKNGIATFTMEDGSEQKVGVNTIKRGIATNEILEDEDNQKKIQGYQKVIDDANKQAAGTGARVLSSLTDINTFDINQFTQEELQKIIGSGDDAGKLDVDDLELLGITSEVIEAAGFDSAKAYIDAFNKKIDEWDPDIAKKLAEERDEAVAQGILEQGAAQYELDLEALEIQAQKIREINDAANLTAEQAAEIAVRNQRLNKGVETLSENWEEWSDILNNSDKDTMEYAETAAELTDVVKELVGATEDFELPDDFFDLQENLDLIEKAAQGDIQAINELGAATAKASVSLAEIDSDFLQKGIDAALANGATNDNIDTISDNILASFESNKLKVIEGIQSLQDAIHNGNVAMGDEFSQTGDILGEDWITALNEMAVATGMSVTEMEDLLSQMHVDAKVVTNYVDQDVTVPRWSTYTSGTTWDRDAKAWKQDSWTVQTGTETMTGKVPVAAISLGDENSPPPAIKYLGSGKVSQSSVKSSSSGGSSKPKKADSVKKSDVVDRYKEINDSLEDIQHTMDQNEKIADSLWGEERFAKMRANIKLLQSENKLLEEKKQLAEDYLVEDKAALERAAAAAGVSLAFDPDTGNIINYTEEMTRLWAQQDSLIAQVNADGNVDEAEQEQLDAQQEKIDNLKDAISQYDETLQEKQDIDAEYLDNQVEIWNQNFELLNEQLELKISFNESDLEIIEYYLSKMEDDFFSMSEAYEILRSKGDEYEEMLGHQKEQYDKLTEAYNKGEISQANFKEGLKEIQSATIDNLESLIDLDREMMEYYGNTLDAASEELGIYTDKMEHLNTVLDHYSSLMELFGKSTDYELMGSILETQADTLRDQLDVAQQNYRMLSEEAEKWKAKMDDALEDPEAFELYKKNWDAAQTAANEAQDEMLSKTQEWAEAMKAIVENELAGLGRTLEETLTGGSSFDDVLTSMERASSLQEEYLTATNKIYETDKLMRKAQQEIDKTQNSVAKRKLQAFINETDQLQSQTKLSQYELDIQQAKYELLLAEIALEEAQQAKSTVRLTRDSEGNFGYVYTADQNQIAEAEQKLADAQNNLYNIGLEGANEYNQKYVETMSEMYDTFAEIHEQFLSGEIATEEDYNAQMLAAKEYYFNKLADFSNLYQVALTTDSRVVRDAWSTDFNSMIYDTENLKSAVTNYTDESATILGEWAGTIKEAMEQTGLDDTSAALKTIGDESDRLLNIILGSDGKKGLLSALEAEIEEVNNLSGAYAGVRKEIKDLITEYENLIKTTNEEYQSDKKPEGEEGAESDETAGDTGPTADPNTNSTSGSGSKAPSLTEGSEIQVKANRNWYYDSTGRGPYGYSSSNRPVKITQIESGAEYPYHIANLNGGALGWIKKEDIVGFKSGGYTGSWGPYGKLGILDEKELILNKGDTANFLASMEVLERILSIIDLHTANAQLGGLLATPGYRDTNSNNQLEQNVHIEASFPGVQDRHELEEAFNNLINQASQYANRK